MNEGAILAQEAVPVHPEDNMKVLQERVKIAEHRIYSRALEMLTSGRAKLDKEKDRVVWRKNIVNGWLF